MKYLIWLSSDCQDLTEIVGALKMGGHDVGLLLVQDGTYLADRGCSESGKLKGLEARVYATKHHVEERGIDKRLVTDVELVDFERVIDVVMEEYDKVISL
jgi:sulfur relay protein TusB/DsrH